MCMKLNEGILVHARENRMKQLERTVANTCYSPKNDFSFLEAQKCEEFHYKNDFKLNAIGSFA